jgi:hypothetical protein
MKLDQWRTPQHMTDPGRQAGLLDGLPADAARLAGIVQGLLIHQHIGSAYGVSFTPAQHAEPHLRRVEQMLERIVAHDPRPLAEARPADRRLVGVCRHFTLLHVAMLRRQGVAARARCGFAAYFEAGRFLDHWVTEYWDAGRGRWILIDAQLDRRQCELFGIAFDPRDVPRDRFLVAGQAWRICRSGAADAGAFGILDMHGLWFIAGNVVRDVAALNNWELLPWDVWGAMTRNDAELDLPLIDRLAGLSRDPDGDLEALRAAYGEQRVAVPDEVFNAVLNRPERAH